MKKSIAFVLLCAMMISVLALAGCSAQNTGNTDGTTAVTTADATGDTTVTAPSDKATATASQSENGEESTALQEPTADNDDLEIMTVPQTSGTESAQPETKTEETDEPATEATENTGETEDIIRLPFVPAQ